MKIFKQISFLLVLLFCGLTAQSQTAKQIDKAIKVFNNKGYTDGIDLLVKYIYKAVEKGGSTFDGYEMWVKMAYVRYLRDKDIYESMSIEVISDDGEEADSSAYKLLEGLKSYPEKLFLNICRKSTLESYSYTGDIHLRQMLVDYDPDTLVSDKAKSYFDEGEEFYGKEDYERAELNYRKALNEDSTYYKALLYLGDTFWAREDYDSAIVYFTMAKNMHPDLLEPRNYIIDALMEKELFYRAKKECLEAFTVYPGFDVKLRFQRILRQENKYFEHERYLRFYYPNNMKTEDQGELMGIGGTYRASKKKISKYCNEDGIIEPNGETTDKYLEVYSFRRMFTEHENELPEYMRFGYKMMEEGYLECYVFINMFHVDIYPQFKDYMSSEENRTKTMEYIEKYLIGVREG